MGFEKIVETDSAKTFSDLFRKWHKTHIGFKSPEVELCSYTLPVAHSKGP